MSGKLLRFMRAGNFDLTVFRLILYFPVSALMTLFGNILQNPLDHRAKSDTKLMNLVVNFLSMLGQEAETGGVHRMLGVCAEFERIAKLVVEKAEKEQSSRRKRKPQDNSKSSLDTSLMQTPRPLSATTPTGNGLNGVNDGHLSPKFNGEANLRQRNSASFSPIAAQLAEPSPAPPSAGWPQDFSMSDQQDFSSFGDMTGFGPNGGIRSPQNMIGVTYQQPLLPQDLFSLPMTLDWDWAEMSGGAYPTVENGTVGNVSR